MLGLIKLSRIDVGGTYRMYCIIHTKFWLDNVKEGDNLGDLAICGRIILKWILETEAESIGGILLARNRVLCWAFVNMVVKLNSTKASWIIISCTRPASWIQGALNYNMRSWYLMVVICEMCRINVPVPWSLIPLLCFFLASMAFLGDSQPAGRKALAVYPVFLFYFVISWLVISYSWSVQLNGMVV
jgi:hypothetical protein